MHFCTFSLRLSKECRTWTADSNPQGGPASYLVLSCGCLACEADRLSKYDCGRPANMLMSAAPAGRAVIPALRSSKCALRTFLVLRCLWIP